MERPAPKRLLADIEAGQIDTVVVYKVDRLTRALSDFARIRAIPQIIAKIAATFFFLAGANSTATAAERWQNQSGIASTYSHNAGKTASGEKPNSEGMTAAHRSLPFGTMVRVTNIANGRSVVVRINDRGPFTRGRVIDLTPAAARALSFSGLARVKLFVVAMEPSTGRHPGKAD